MILFVFATCLRLFDQLVYTRKWLSELTVYFSMGMVGPQCGLAVPAWCGYSYAGTQNNV